MTMMTRAGVFALAIGCALALGTSTAGAGERKVTRGWEGARGGSATITRSRGNGTATRELQRSGPRGASVEKSATRGGGIRTRDVTRTGPNGGSVEKSVTRGGGTATRDVTRTSPGGKSLERSSERVVDRDNQSVTKSSGTTYPDGTTSSRTRTTTKNDDGSYTVEGERTNRAGETKTFSGTVTRE